MTTSELEYRLLFAMVVAGKSEKFATAAMRRFLVESWCDDTPFSYVRRLIQQDSPSLFDVLKEARTGNYCKLCAGFAAAAKSGIDLRTCSPADLEQIHGIGPKTSRFFIIWTRPEAEFAALDTHILKWLRYLGHKAPKSTPTGWKYANLEKIILAEAKARGMTARELDAAIWDHCSNGLHVNGEWPERLSIDAALADQTEGKK